MNPRIKALLARSTGVNVRRHRGGSITIKITSKEARNAEVVAAKYGSQQGALLILGQISLQLEQILTPATTRTVVVSDLPRSRHQLSRSFND